MQKLRRSNSKMDLVKVNGYVTFHQIPSIRHLIGKPNKISTTNKDHNFVVYFRKWRVTIPT